ncbi:DUF6263 family protein [uncultured Psychroserpens sp.]|uniref:DUF6263 family protein n=1 Tax=uncultured Psychroserpens sp. TaxID=255436 RepID=UPI002608AAB7|nr:DUF6263 family protein [uncultured Psychroserpens sp.]
MKSFFIYLFTVFVASTCHLDAQTNLTYNLNVGDRFKVYQVANQDIVQEMNGTKHEMTNALEGDFTFTVQSVNDSIYNIKFKFDRFKMLSTSNLAGELFNINTNDSIADNDIQGKIFSQLVTCDLYMEMYKNGKIKSIKGSQKLIDKMISASGDFDSFTKELMKESMKKEFSNESLAMSFEQMTYIYPSEAVSNGDSWKNRFKGDLSADNLWTLENIANNEVTINGESSIIFATKDDDIEMNLKGDMTSKVVTSFDTGFVKTMTTYSTAKGNSIMHNMNDLDVPTTITSNITYKIEKDVQ